MSPEPSLIIPSVLSISIRDQIIFNRWPRRWKHSQRWECVSARNNGRSQVPDHKRPVQVEGCTLESGWRQSTLFCYALLSSSSESRAEQTWKRGRNRSNSCSRTFYIFCTVKYGKKYVKVWVIKMSTSTSSSSYVSDLTRFSFFRVRNPWCDGHNWRRCQIKKHRHKTAVCKYYLDRSCSYIFTFKREYFHTSHQVA